MSTHWTAAQDEFLIRYQSVTQGFIVANPLATFEENVDHMTALKASGATLALAKAKLLYLEFMDIAGTSGSTGVTRDMHREEVVFWQALVDGLQPVARLEIVR